MLPDARSSHDKTFKQCRISCWAVKAKDSNMCFKDEDWGGMRHVEQKVKSGMIRKVYRQIRYIRYAWKKYLFSACQSPSGATPEEISNRGRKSIKCMFWSTLWNIPYILWRNEWQQLLSSVLSYCRVDVGLVYVYTCLKSSETLRRIYTRTCENGRFLFWTKTPTKMNQSVSNFNMDVNKSVEKQMEKWKAIVSDYNCGFKSGHTLLGLEMWMYTELTNHIHPRVKYFYIISRGSQGKKSISNNVLYVPSLARIRKKKI